MTEQFEDERALLRLVVRSPGARFLLRLFPAEFLCDIGHVFASRAMQTSHAGTGRVEWDATREALQRLAGNNADKLLQMLIDFPLSHEESPSRCARRFLYQQFNKQKRAAIVQGIKPTEKPRIFT